jgi:hypothetical protein
MMNIARDLVIPCHGIEESALRMLLPFGAVAFNEASPSCDEFDS